MADQKRNPKNYENPLFKALTRLLSGPIVDRRKQNPRQLKRGQLNKYKFTSPGGLSFMKSAYDPFDNIRTSAYQNINRAERYIDFDQMEYMPEIASALDIYADEMTVSSPLQEILQVNCPNEEIKEVLNQLFYNVLNIEFNIFGWCRSMCKLVTTFCIWILMMIWEYKVLLVYLHKKLKDLRVKIKPILTMFNFNGTVVD